MWTAHETALTQGYIHLHTLLVMVQTANNCRLGLPNPNPNPNPNTNPNTKPYGTPSHYILRPIVTSKPQYTDPTGPYEQL